MNVNLIQDAFALVDSDGVVGTRYPDSHDDLDGRSVNQANGITSARLTRAWATGDNLDVDILNVTFCLAHFIIP